MKFPVVPCVALLASVLGAPVFAKEKPDPNVPTPEAQVLIDQVKTAYGNLHTLKLGGKVSADINVGGHKDAKSIEFVGEYQAPGQYRHQVKDQLVTGSTGTKMYIHELTQDVYSVFDAPAQKTAYRQLPGVLGQILEVQDPGLLLAVSTNSVADMIEGAKHVRLAQLPESELPAKSTLAFTAGDGRDITLVFDPKSHLLTQAKYDLAEMMRTRGAEQVNNALVTIDYSDIQPDAKLDAAEFAWTPPANAREIPANIGGGIDGSHLVGKAMPDFTLSDLSGKSVKLSSLKGSVVLLDFWATWCPPCVRSLPEINELYHAGRDSGVKVYAVNVGEDKDTVQSFLTAQKLDLPVLLDENEDTFTKLGINGVPVTVIVDAQGNVHKVFVGIPTGGKPEIQREIDAAAKHAPAQM